MSRHDLPWKAPQTRPKFADKQLDAFSKELEKRWDAVDRQLLKAWQSAVRNDARLEGLERQLAALRADLKLPS